jgi:hypothetical protein
MMDLGSTLFGTGVTAIALGVFNFFTQRRKLGADTAAVLTETAMELIPPLRAEIKELRSEILELRKQVRAITADLDACYDLNRHKDDLIAALTHEKSISEEPRP